MMRIFGTIAVAAMVGIGVSAQSAEVKVAYLPCGPVNDHSWSQGGFDGLKMAKQVLAGSGTAMTIDYSESVPPAQVEGAARDFASRGYNIVVLHCGTFAEAAVNAARAFPKTTFLLSTAPPTKDTPSNFWSYDAAQQEPAFITGYLAGLVSKSGRVGAIGGFDFPALTRQIEGFRLGARYANAKMKSSATFINSWDDAGKAKEAAQAQIDSGADVIFAGTDQAARGIFAAAEGSGTYAIAGFSDQTSLSPKSILASVVTDFPGLVRDLVVKAVDGKLEQGKFYQIGLGGGVGAVILNPALDNVISNDVKAKVAKVTQDIKAGRLKIPELIKPGLSESVDLDSLEVR